MRNLTEKSGGKAGRADYAIAFPGDLGGFQQFAKGVVLSVVSKLGGDAAGQSHDGSQ